MRSGIGYHPATVQPLGGPDYGGAVGPGERPGEVVHQDLWMVVGVKPADFHQYGVALLGLPNSPPVAGGQGGKSDQGFHATTLSGVSGNGSASAGGILMKIILPASTKTLGVEMYPPFACRSTTSPIPRSRASL